MSNVVKVDFGAARKHAGGPRPQSARAAQRGELAGREETVGEDALRRDSGSSDSGRLETAHLAAVRQDSALSPAHPAWRGVAKRQAEAASRPAVQQGERPNLQQGLQQGVQQGNLEATAAGQVAADEPAKANAVTEKTAEPPAGQGLGGAGAVLAGKTGGKLRLIELGPRPAKDGPALSEAQAPVKAAALKMLARSNRPRAQLARDLAAKDFEAADIEVVLDRLEAAGLIDDLEYARRFIETRSRKSGISRRQLSEELRQKGLDSSTISQALSEREEDADFCAALDFAQRKARSLAAKDRAAAHRSLLGALARRGFSGDICRRVAAQVLGGGHEEC